MLDTAIKHERALQERFHGIWYDEKYKFYDMSAECCSYDADKTNWDKFEFTSHNAAGEVIGYFAYNVHRNHWYAHGLRIISFTDDYGWTFASDLRQVLCEIFERFNFRKLTFEVIIGNPAEKSYDKMVLKNGGRIAGTSRESVRLWDGKYYDYKIYEVMREDYLKAKGERTDDKS